MAPRTAQVVVCGAGIAGVSTAYHLTVRCGVRDVVLVDPRAPLSLTSDKSTECYRNWWPGPGRAMVGLMNRSVDLLDRWADDSGNAFALNRRGYLYVTADAARLAEMQASAEAISALGAGPVRIHRGSPGEDSYVPAAPDGYRDSPDGADLILDRSLLHRNFPGLSKEAVGALHVRRAGWLSAQQLGSYLLHEARAAGLRVVRRRVESVDLAGGRVAGVRLAHGGRIATGALVNAAGPLLDEVGHMVGEDLPVVSEVHRKIAFRDTAGALPRNAPLMIWTDPQRIDWSAEERDYLAEEGRADLLEELPGACHGRPEGGADSPWLLALWEYRTELHNPVWPLPEDPFYPEVVIRGMTTMIPAMAVYQDRLPRVVVDGGYYTKTRENRPLIGPLRTEGAYVVGALSGFGIMAAAAAGELAALHVTSGDLPAYAPAFLPARYDDPAYLQALSDLTDTGQL